MPFGVHRPICRWIQVLHKLMALHRSARSRLSGPLTPKGEWTLLWGEWSTHSWQRRRTILREERRKPTMANLNKRWNIFKDQKIRPVAFNSNTRKPWTGRLQFYTERKLIIIIIKKGTLYDENPDQNIIEFRHIEHIMLSVQPAWINRLIECSYVPISLLKSSTTLTQTL